jgi:hypothetical protein
MASARGWCRECRSGQCAWLDACGGKCNMLAMGTIQPQEGWRGELECRVHWPGSDDSKQVERHELILISGACPVFARASSGAGCPSPPTTTCRHTWQSLRPSTHDIYSAARQRCPTHLRASLASVQCMNFFSHASQHACWIGVVQMRTMQSSPATASDGRSVEMEGCVCDPCCVFPVAAVAHAIRSPRSVTGGPGTSRS